MWGKNDSPNPAAAPKPPVSSQPEPAVSAPAASVAPAIPSSAMADPSAHGRPAQSIIGKGLVTKADISGSEDLRVDGELEGSIKIPECSVTIGPNGNVKANVVARNITVHGTLRGNLQATGKIEIRKTGSLLGDVTTAGITIEDGAYFKGSIDILRPEPARPAARPEPKQEQRQSRPEASKPEMQPVVSAAASSQNASRPAAPSSR